MPNKGKRRVVRKSGKVEHLYSQAERARKLASECGSQLVADLFEIHAELCERQCPEAPTKAANIMMEAAMHNAFNPQEIALLVKVVDEACVQ